GAAGSVANEPPANSQNTAVNLARGFALLIRLIADLMTGQQQQQHGGSGLDPLLTGQQQSSSSSSGGLPAHLQPRVPASAREAVQATLQDSWNWLVTLTDSLESQLRFGAKFTVANRAAVAAAATAGRSSASGAGRSSAGIGSAAAGSSSSQQQQQQHHHGQAPSGYFVAGSAAVSAVGGSGLSEANTQRTLSAMNRRELQHYTLS
uniref:E3 ubiquitin-protein ligase n=1 Tax=Macrostomum lignano TaxID=282301 RepID=A0A1I8HTC8_9PLAT